MDDHFRPATPAGDHWSPRMTLFARAAVALVLAAAVAGPASAQKAPAPKPATTKPAAGAQVRLATDKAKVSYLIGMDVGKSIAPAGPDIDMAALQRAIRNGLDGGKPLIAEAQVQAVTQALIARVGARNGKAPPGAPVPAVAKDQVGYLVGADVGNRLAPIADEIDLAVLMQGMRASLEGTKPLMDEAEANAVRTAFSERISAKMQAQAAELGRRNTAEGEAFLAKHKLEKGVFTTPSGLQYMVLRQGSGQRPGPHDRVRVNYRGTLLDGTEFDSSYARNAPAEFGLDQVIPGWTEGLGLMPVGSKYRFWIPANLAYGEQGTPGGPVGPNATLVFDVELLAIPN
jgi:FKBP-type peptidyl-prolyl cis-trans isomerase FkpA